MDAVYNIFGKIRFRDVKPLKDVTVRTLQRRDKEMKDYSIHLGYKDEMEYIQRRFTIKYKRNQEFRSLVLQATLSDNVKKLNHDTRDFEVSEEGTLYHYILRICSRTSKANYQILRNSIWNRHYVGDDGKMHRERKTDGNGLYYTMGTSLYTHNKIKKKVLEDYPGLEFKELSDGIFVANFINIISEYFEVWSYAEELDDNFDFLSMD